MQIGQYDTVFCAYADVAFPACLIYGATMMVLVALKAQRHEPYTCTDTYNNFGTPGTSGISITSIKAPSIPLRPLGPLK